jgi:hypothetical protein
LDKHAERARTQCLDGTKEQDSIAQKGATGAEKLEKKAGTVTGRGRQYGWRPLSDRLASSDFFLPRLFARALLEQPRQSVTELVYGVRLQYQIAKADFTGGFAVLRANVP